MPTIKIIREGRQIGTLKIGDSSEKFTVLEPHEGGERGLVIVIELELDRLNTQAGKILQSQTCFYQTIKCFNCFNALL